MEKLDKIVTLEPINEEDLHKLLEIVEHQNMNNSPNPNIEMRRRTVRRNLENEDLEGVHITPSGELGSEHLGGVPDMQQPGALQIIGAFFAQISEEPKACQWYLIFAVMTVICTFFEINDYTKFSLIYIHEKGEYWRIFTWPLVDGGQFSNFLSILYSYFNLRLFEQVYGSFFATASLIVGYLCISLFPLCLLPIYSEERLSPMGFMTFSGTWPITFFIFTISILPHPSEITQFLTFSSISVTEKINCFLMLLAWQIICYPSGGDVGSIISVFFALILVLFVPHYKTIQNLERNCFQRSPQNLTLNENIFVVSRPKETASNINNKKDGIATTPQSSSLNKSPFGAPNEPTLQEEERHLMSSETD